MSTGANLTFAGIQGGPTTDLLAGTPQDVTANWVNLGAEQAVKGAKFIALWLDVDINDSTNVRIRALIKLTEGGTLEYSLPIRSVAAAVVQVEPEMYEFNVDADQQMVLSWELDGIVPWVQFQIQAGAVGGTAGQIETAFAVTAH